MTYRLLLLTWILVLFHPLRMVNQYVGGLSAFYWLQSLLLACLLPLWIMERARKRNFTLLMLLVALHALSTLLVAENTGYARTATRMIFEVYLLGIVTLSLCAEKRRLEALLRLFALNFIYYAFWGVRGGGKIGWDYVLDDSNQFGTYMGMGVAFCFCYFAAHRVGRGRWLGLAGAAASLLGAIASFSRGSFLALTVSYAYLWVRAKRRVAVTLAGCAGGVLLFVAANWLFPGGEFWQEMKTIQSGTAAGTGLDRKVLWGIAWNQFKANPLLGVGVHNFGVLAPVYAGEEARVRYPDLRTLWGRSPHNIYFQVLAEQGIVGMTLFLVLLGSFWKENRKMRKALEPFVKRTPRSERELTGGRIEARRYANYADGILVAAVCYLIGGFFYPIYEYPWLWSLLIINRLLRLVVSAEIARRQDAGIAGRRVSGAGT
ncbi:MAG: O-antigen ligase family protein [bacterium]